MPNLPSTIAKHIQHLELASQISNLANSSLDLRDVLKRILRGVREATGADVGMIFLKDLESGKLCWGASSGLSQQFINDFQHRLIQPGEGLSGLISQQGQAIYIREDSSHDPRISRLSVQNEGLNTFIGLPIIVENEVVAVMNILTRPPKILEEEDEIALIKLVASFVGTAIHNATLYSDLQQQKQALHRAHSALERRVENQCQELEESETLFRQMADNISEVYYLTTPDYQKILYISPAFETIWGISCEKLRNNFETWFKYIHPDDIERVRETYLSNDDYEEFDIEYRILRPDGALRWIHNRTYAIHNQAGNIYRIAGIAEDITLRIEAELQLLNAQQIKMNKLISALEQVADAVTITDYQGVIEYTNPAFETITGYHFNEVVGKKANILKSGKQPDEFYAHLWKSILSGKAFQSVFINRRKDSQIYYEEKTISPLKNEQGEITHFISTGKNITDRMRAEERLQHLAYHDVLTGLPNRALFRDRLEHAIIKRISTKLALMFLDLDHFKNINDTLGHDAGDELLTQLPARLNQCVREEDTIARFGGDEFAILLENIPSIDVVSNIAEKILKSLAAPFNIGSNELFVTTSLGVVIYPDDGDNMETLFRYADAAMYRAKDLGRNACQFYSGEIGAQIAERMQLETHLRRALEKEEFQLVYQPQINACTGKICGVESLLRWQHPELGEISPSRFIPLLEDIGLIIPVGEWVLRNACQQAKQWQQHYHPEFRIAVNLSGRQFRSQELKHKIVEILTELEMSPHLLELEITESILMQDDKVSMENLRALKKLGIKLSIDDFGTGYSSLSYLKRFALDTLKIDRSFIKGIPNDIDDAAIVTAIVAMAKKLKLDVVAEGVENAEQLDFLTEAGCNVIQGFYYSQAQSPEVINKMLKTLL